MCGVLSGRHGPAFLLFVAAASACAQGSSRPAADPLDPAATVPPVVYRSSLREMPRLTEQAVGDWRAANDTVTRIGGWRTYLREAQQPAPAPTPASPASTAPSSTAPAAPARPPGAAAHHHPHHHAPSSSAPGRPDARQEGRP
jgi:hypothetical protein